MRCGRRCGAGWPLVLALLLFCSLSSYAQSSDDIDPGWIYEISGAQLLTLRDTLATQEMQLMGLSQELQMSKRTLAVVQSEWQTSRKEIGMLEASSMILSEMALSAEARATRYRNLAIGLGATTAGGVLFILFTIFGR